MSESSENHQYTISDIIVFFLSEVQDEKRSSTAESYRKAVASLKCYISDCQPKLLDFSDEFLKGWLTAMFQNGRSHKVAKYYLKIIAALYNRAVDRGLAKHTDAFRHIAEQLSSIERHDFDLKRRDHDYTRLISMARAIRKTDNHNAMFADMFLASVLSGAQITPVNIARMKKDEISALPAAMQTICHRHESAQRRYVFNLNQSQKTARQLSREIDAAMLQIMRRYGINGTPADAPANLWAHTALKCGYSPSAIISSLGMRPAANPVFAFCDFKELSTEEAETIRNEVARVIMTDPQEWFVMRLRPTVRFNRLQERLATISAETSVPQLFFPSEEIAMRIGRKLVYRDRPLLPDIVFFRCRRTQVRPLFRQIGDIAWCYVSSRSDTGSYAAIPDSEMQRFQQAIGQFTPEYDLYPAGTLTPSEGESVVIIGGLFTGQKGEIERIMPGKTDSVIYRVVFPDNQGIEWRVNIDARLIRKADATSAINPNPRQAYNLAHA